MAGYAHPRLDANHLLHERRLASVLAAVRPSAESVGSQLFEFRLLELVDQAQFATWKFENEISEVVRNYLFIGSPAEMPKNAYPD